MIIKVKKKDTVVLIDTAFRKFLVDTGGKTDKIKGVGVIDPSILVGKKYGEQIEIGNKQFWGYVLTRYIYNKNRNLLFD